MMNKDAEWKTFFKSLDAKIKVNRVKATLSTLVTHNVALKEGSSSRYKLTRVELKTFKFSGGS